MKSGPFSLAVHGQQIGGVFDVHRTLSYSKRRHGIRRAHEGGRRFPFTLKGLNSRSSTAISKSQKVRLSAAAQAKHVDPGRGGVGARLLVDADLYSFF